MTPKLADLSDETRRILCAESLGWKSLQFVFERGLFGYAPNDPFPHDLGANLAPDPDNDANAALELVEVLRRAGVKSTHHATPEGYAWAFWMNDGEIHEGKADTLPCSIVSAYLKAKGLAQ